MIYTSYDKPKDIQQIVPADTASHYTYIGALLEGLLASGLVAYNRSQFFYGPDRARYKQILARVGGPPQNETTYYVGDLYEKVYAGSAITHRNFIRAYGQVIAISSFFSSGEQTHYLHRDHIDSVDVITRENSTVVEKLSYDAFGKRRNANWTADTGSTLLYGSLHATPRGFTGHEHLDAVALVHMNGRVYDPIFGRFLSADPFVQFPESTQGLNRYSYVNNNPLSYTDPSGFGLWSKLKKWLGRNEVARTILAIAVNFIPVPGGAQELSFILLRGFASGLVSSAGDLKQGFISAATAGISNGIGDLFDAEKLGGLSHLKDVDRLVVKSILHGLNGGVASDLSGGKFGSGFLSGGFSEAAAESGLAETLGGGSTSGEAIATIVIGGTASELGGGKFANGAVTASFVYAYNELLHYGVTETGEPTTRAPAGMENAGGAFSVIPGVDLLTCLDGCSGFGWGFAALGVSPLGKVGSVAKSLGANPFKGKTAEQIGDMLSAKGYVPMGQNPVKGQGNFVNPRTGRGYHIDVTHGPPKGPHVGVHRPRGMRDVMKPRDYPTE